MCVVLIVDFECVGVCVLMCDVCGVFVYVFVMVDRCVVCLLCGCWLVLLSCVVCVSMCVVVVCMVDVCCCVCLLIVGVCLLVCVVVCWLLLC